jgi:hypothetical protein
MVYFQTKNHNLGKFWSVLQWKMLVFEREAIWSILLPLGIFYGHLEHFVVFWYIFAVFLVCCTKKNLATLVGRFRKTAPVFKVESFQTALQKL